MVKSFCLVVLGVVVVACSLSPQWCFIPYVLHAVGLCIE